jgi:hypothetical protein
LENNAVRIASIIGAVAMYINDPLKSMKQLIAYIVGFGLVFAKDSDVTGEVVIKPLFK